MTRHSGYDDSPDIYAIARETMLDAGFVADMPAAVNDEVNAVTRNGAAKPSTPDGPAFRDMRDLLWSSIDNKKSRDLDQVEYAEKLPDRSVRLLVGIADVDALVSQNSAIDKCAATNCTSVYTGVKTFPMLPEELSTDLSSLNPKEDRLAIVTEMVVSAAGVVTSGNIYRAYIRNHAKLAYESVGGWLDGEASVPPEVQSVPGLAEQLQLQFESAKDLSEMRKQHGAIELGMIQATPVVNDVGQITELEVVEPNGARDLIASFMIAANVQMAEFLEAQGGSSLRRIVRTPKYWSRIVEIADEVGEKLPPTPDSRALADFLARRKAADLLHFPDLSLAVAKSLGPGEYAVELPGHQSEGHFGLALQDYTHSTAPNRRFADLVTQRLVKAALTKKPSPYQDSELTQIAEHCTEREDAARKVERKMRKVAAAVLLRDKIGQNFQAIVTGVTPKGTFARILNPPVDGRVMRGEGGLRVGDKVKVRLLSVDPERGFIDFARA